MPSTPVTLDPVDWREMRAQGHRMLDDMFDYVERLRDHPVWQPIPQDVRELFRESLPHHPTDLASVHKIFLRNILPFAVGNSHPGFFGWVQGGGTAVGRLAEMLAAGVNANVGGRDQIPIEVERQILRWVRELFEFPETASGIFVTGASLANFIGLLVARTARLGREVREQGISKRGSKLVAYTSAGAHGCIAQAMEMAGLGSRSLRRIPLNADFQIDIQALQAAITADRTEGLNPFLIVGTAGSVDVGSIDDLHALADIAQRERLWLHVDGALGALGMLSPHVSPKLAGIQRADSIAFDFHKWGQVPYDAGYILVRDGALHEATFAAEANYLQRDERALSAGSPWPCDFGPDLSRGFRALKTWFTLKVYGTEALGRMITETCRLAQYLQSRIERTNQLELLAPVPLNIVCFRYRGKDADVLNAGIVAELQRSGIAAPSTTIINNQLAIRAAVVNHRTTAVDLDAMLQAILEIGHRYAHEMES